MVILSIIISVIAIIIDQLTKILLYGKSFSLIGDFLWVQTAFNDGAAFGMLGGARWFFIVLSIPVIAIIIYFIVTKKLGNTKFLGITFGLLLGGIIGNLIDRIFLGGVRDFIYFKSINFAIFNFADAFICVGVVLLVIFILFLYKPNDKHDNKVNIDKINDNTEINNNKEKKESDK